MLLLTATTDKLSLITSAAVTVDVHASFMDMSQVDPPVMKGTTSGKLNTAITTIATTDIVPAPGATTTRNVKTLHIRNKHATLQVDVTVQFNQGGTLFELCKVTLKAGDILQYVEGVGFFLMPVTPPGVLFKVLAADDAGGQNVATAQPWFPTAGGVTVVANTTYLMEGLLAISRAAGVTSHTTGLLFAGTATLTSIQYQADVNTGDVDATSADSRTISRVATNTPVKAASVSATEQISVRLAGIVRINAAGTFIPQFIYSAIPGGTPTIKANSFFRMTPLGDGGVVSQGVWA